jgi:hypothetical protein
VYQKGDILLDKVQESEVVVTQMLSERCDEVIVKNKNVAKNRYSDSTVYDYNSRYGCEPQEPVVKAVYAESLPSNPHELTKEGRDLLARNTDSKVYSFPISRLVPIDDPENRS